MPHCGTKGYLVEMQPRMTLLDDARSNSKLIALHSLS
jgi:hypothetical protein